MFEVTGLAALDLYQDPQSALKKKWATLMRKILKNLTHDHRVNIMKQ